MHFLGLVSALLAFFSLKLATAEYNGARCFFVTYGNDNFVRSRGRVVSEAKNMGVFDQARYFSQARADVFDGSSSEHRMTSRLNSSKQRNLILTDLEEAATGSGSRLSFIWSSLALKPWVYLSRLFWA
jgi:hypothetical protein